jgi:hypothetical protein
MDALAAELTEYMDKSEGRGNKVIAINGLRAIIKRHETSVTPHTRTYPSTDEYLQERELQRSYAASRSSKIH